MLLFFFSAITAISTGCKKGDGDPFISLSSRKARMAGKWKLTSAIEKNKTVSSTISYSSTITYDGTNTTSIVDDGMGSSVTEVSPYSEEWEIDKDGTFTTTQNDDGDITILKGTWNFTGGVGEMKRKSRLLYQLFL